MQLRGSYGCANIARGREIRIGLFRNEDPSLSHHKFSCTTNILARFFLKLDEALCNNNKNFLSVFNCLLISSSEDTFNMHEYLLFMRLFLKLTFAVVPL